MAVAVAPTAPVVVGLEGAVAAAVVAGAEPGAALAAGPGGPAVSVAGVLKLRFGAVVRPS